MVKFDIILKYFAGKALPEEAMQIDDWANESEENKDFLKQIQATWLATNGETYQNPNLAKEWERLQSNRNPINTVPLQTSKYLWITRVAALLAIVATAFGGYYLFNSNNQNLPTITAEAKDRTLNLKLTDGSQIDLQPQAALIYPTAFAKNIREVTLIGDGNLRIDHEATRPFFVHMGELHIKILGTQFNVKQNKEEVTVLVTQGKVAFYNSKDTLIIPEGNLGTYNKDKHKFALTALVPEFGDFQFNDTPLDQATKELSAYFHVRFQFENGAIKNCKLSAGFEHQTFAEIIKAISATFDIEYKQQGNVISLSGKGCK